MPVYHFTSLLHLPYILTDGELVGAPARNGFPKDFVWGTTNPAGDRTAAICHSFRTSTSPMIRITLRDDLFQNWETLIEETEGWTSVHRDILFMAGQDMGGEPDKWVAAEGPIPVNDDTVIAIEKRTYTTPWTPVKLTGVKYDWGYLWFKLGREQWKVSRHRQEDGRLFYKGSKAA